MDAIAKVTSGTCMVHTGWSKTKILVVETSEAERQLTNSSQKKVAFFTQK